MKAYIQSTSCISPQQTFTQANSSGKMKEYQTVRFSCIEPEYSSIIDAKLIRRMSRIVRMGVATGIQALQSAGVQNPDAIITGTAYGCLEDTEAFLKRMTEYNEELLTPTAFIQSTHNTVAGQIALMLHCNSYNNTFVHRGFSFESALLDGLLYLKENPGHVLVGGVDELTSTSFNILRRFGLFKTIPVANKELFTCNSPGTIAGEGAAFFVISDRQVHETLAAIEAPETFYSANFRETEKWIENFLQKHSFNPGANDLVITGKNGDNRSDKLYDDLETTIFKGASVIYYKHLCGEYPVSSAFALWLATQILNKETELVTDDIGSRSIERIFIFNQYLKKYNSLMLVSKC